MKSIIVLSYHENATIDYGIVIDETAHSASFLQSSYQFLDGNAVILCEDRLFRVNCFYPAGLFKQIHTFPFEGQSDDNPLIWSHESVVYFEALYWVLYARHLWPATLIRTLASSLQTLRYPSSGEMGPTDMSSSLIVTGHLISSTNSRHSLHLRTHESGLTHSSMYPHALHQPCPVPAGFNSVFSAEYASMSLGQGKTQDSLWKTSMAVHKNEARGSILICSHSGIREWWISVPFSHSLL